MKSMGKLLSLGQGFLMANKEKFPAYKAYFRLIPENSKLIHYIPVTVWGPAQNLPWANAFAPATFFNSGTGEFLDVQVPLRDLIGEE